MGLMNIDGLTRPIKHAFLAFLLTYTLLGLSHLVFSAHGPFKAWEQKLYDYRLGLPRWLAEKALGPIPVDNADGEKIKRINGRLNLRDLTVIDQIKVIGFWQKFDYGTWQGKSEYELRRAYADLIELLASLKNTVTAVDIFFLPEKPGGDLLFEASQKAGNVVWVMKPTLTKEQEAGLHAVNSDDPVLKEQLLALKKFSFTGEIGNLWRTSGSPDTKHYFPPPILSNHSLAIAHERLSTDTDGTVRRLPLLIELDGRLFPSLSLVTAAHLLDVPLKQIKLIPGKKIVLPSANFFKLGLEGKRDLEIPVDEHGQMHINFAPVTAWYYSLETFFFSKVLKAGQEPRMHAELQDKFTNKVCFIGDCTELEKAGDRFPTAINPRMPGVLIHANALYTILTEKFIRPVGWINILITGLLPALLAFCSPFLSSKKFFFVFLSLLLGYTGLNTAVLLRWGYFAHLLDPLLALFIYFQLAQASVRSSAYHREQTLSPKRPPSFLEIKEEDQTVEEPGPTLFLEVFGEKEKIKIAVQEGKTLEESTLHYYEDNPLNWELLTQHGHAVSQTMNSFNRDGRLAAQSLDTLKRQGRMLLDEIFPPNLKELLLSSRAEQMVVRIDSSLVHIPWELLYDGNRFFCLRWAMGRVVRTPQKIYRSSQRSLTLPLEMLIVADPRGNLSAAYQEGIHIRDMLDGAYGKMEPHLLSHRVTADTIKERLKECDILHYAGHADYLPDDPAKSGWLVHDSKITAGEIMQMAGGQPLPSLVFVNACRSGQTENRPLREVGNEQIFGLANAFLAAGCRHYVGTFWDIQDEPSSKFAQFFYQNLINGAAVGKALKGARERVINEYSESAIAWATYMLYGDPTYTYIKKE